ncbi:MAG TPA: virulence factor [Burkholderiaceae bacterium]|nr:virulence factor [Burkholderiaceae bacterium]
MAKVQILYWQDIPSVVEAREGRDLHKVQLSQRFQELIDLIAMRKGLSGSDAYLEQWAKGSAEVRDGDARTVAEVVAGEIEAKYEAIRSAQLAAINPSAE